jgi:hypothetical protein
LAATSAPLPRKSAVGAASASSVLRRLQIRNILFLLLRYSYCQHTAVHRPYRRERPGAKAGSSSVGGVGAVKCLWANGRMGCLILLLTVYGSVISCPIGCLYVASGLAGTKQRQRHRGTRRGRAITDMGRLFRFEPVLQQVDGG